MTRPTLLHVPPWHREALNVYVPLHDPYRQLFCDYTDMHIELTYRDHEQALIDAVNRELQLIAAESE